MPVPMKISTQKTPSQSEVTVPDDDEGNLSNPAGSNQPANQTGRSLKFRPDLRQRRGRDTNSGEMGSESDSDDDYPGAAQVNVPGHPDVSSDTDSDNMEDDSLPLPPVRQNLGNGSHERAQLSSDSD